MVKKFSEHTKDLEGKNLSEDITYNNMSEEDTMFEMANLPPRRTGLKYQIWYSAKVEKHKPRIKVDLGDGNSISVQIEDHKVIGATDKISSKDLNDIFTWIDMNKEILMAYWNDAHTGVIDNGDVIEKVKKLQ